MTTQELDELFNKSLPSPLFQSSFPLYPIRVPQVTPTKKAVIQKRTVNAISLHPKNVIFNPPATIVEWEDGSKTVVKCHDDEFSEEFGYAMAVMRKIYGSRKEFLAQFKNAYRPYLKPKKPKNKAKNQTDGCEQG